LRKKTRNLKEKEFQEATSMQIANSKTKIKMTNIDRHCTFSKGLPTKEATLRVRIRHYKYFENEEKRGGNQKD
jgi:hypothetical protein